MIEISAECNKGHHRSEFSINTLGAWLEFLGFSVTYRRHHLRPIPHVRDKPECGCGTPEGCAIRGCESGSAWARGEAEVAAKVKACMLALYAAVAADLDTAGSIELDPFVSESWWAPGRVPSDIAATLPSLAPSPCWSWA